MPTAQFLALVRMALGGRRDVLEKSRETESCAQHAQGELRSFTERLRCRLANWNPDWQDESSLANLDAFGRAHPDAVGPALEYIYGTPDRFGRSLYHALDLRLRTPQL